MGLTKEDLLRTGVPHQTALVKRLQDAPLKPVRHYIPGGKNLLQQIDKDTMVDAIFTWLRRVHRFKDVTISFAHELAEFTPTVEKVWDLEVVSLPNSSVRRPEWEVNNKGKKYLAERLRDAIWAGPCLGVKADYDGIYILRDPDDNFSPTRKITEEDLEQQELLLEEIYTETKAKAAELEIEWKKPEIELLELGDTITAENWDPYIEFMPTRKKEYGS